MSSYRPRDVALFLLASGDLMPRQRARDQQSDLAGLHLKREVLERLVALDPEPEAFEPALESIIVAIGQPYGPTRGVCLNVRDEWDDMSTTPAFAEWLLQQAVYESTRPPRGKKRRGQVDS